MQPRIIILLSILGISMVILRLIGHSDNDEVSGPGDQENRFTIENLKLKRFDADGALKYQLLSKTIEQDAATGESVISKPVAWFFEANQPRWKLTADQGWLNGPQTVAKLDQNVQVVGTKQSDLLATMPELTVDLVAEVADNTHPVEITMNKSKVNGVGLQADFTKSRLTLKSQVRGVYVP